MLVTRKRLTELEKQIAELEDVIRRRDSRIEMLENELALETSWAEGEIEFWQDECNSAEASAAILRTINDSLCTSLEELHNRKPWYRYVIS